MEVDKDIKLDVTKDFPVPIEKLYKAWTAPEELKKWWQPMGNHLKDVTINLHEGGNFSYEFENRESDHSFRITGQYQLVEEQKRLVYTWNWEIPTESIANSQFQLTIVFSKQGSGSHLQVTQQNFSNEEAVHPHREGWNKALEDLHQYLSKG